MIIIILIYNIQILAYNRQGISNIGLKLSRNIAYHNSSRLHVIEKFSLRTGSRVQRDTSVDMMSNVQLLLVI